MTGKKKILIISNGFYPEISPRSQRATELVKEFCRLGHSVVVISKFRNHNYFEFLKEFPITLKMWGKSRFPKIVGFKNKPFSYLSRGISRLLLILFEYPGIEDMFEVKKMLKHESEYDLMISFAFPHPVHWGVAWSVSAKYMIAGTWVADCGDPYMGDKTDTFRKLFYFKYFEKWFCRKADYITVPIESAKDAYYGEFREKIIVIPQGFDFSNLKHASYRKNEDYPIFAFAGSLTMYIDTAPAFFKFLLSSTAYFKLIIYTEILGWVEEYVNKLGDKVEVKGYIEREQLIYELSKMDFLVNFNYKTNVQKSSKLISYSLSGRPILNIEAGVDCEPIVKEFFEGNYNQQYVIRNLEGHNIKNVAQRFINLAR
jgi:hypothetical protein